MTTSVRYNGHLLVADPSQGYVEIWHNGALIAREDTMGLAKRWVDTDGNL